MRTAAVYPYWQERRHMATILLAEDNNLIREAVAGYLQLDGHTTLEFSSAAGILETVQRGGVDLLILDIMLPDGNGLALARSIRASPACADVPIMFLTAKDSESDRILGFEQGADDYICKPFSAKELVLRVQAILRRTQPPHAQTELEFYTWTHGGDTVCMDAARHLLTVNGAPRSLTGAEWKIFTHLAAHCGQVMSREQILAECLNYFYEGSERTVDTHIANLRAKLGGGWISTVRGYGYRFDGTRTDIPAAPSAEHT